MNLTTLSELQNNFKLALKNASSTKYLIENELKEINNFLNYDPLEKYNNRGLRKFLIKPESQRIFKIPIQNYQRTLFTEAFNNYMINGKFDIPKYEGITDDQFNDNQSVVKQAFEFSNYYKWLTSLKETPEKSIKKSSLDHKEKLLALHYLGLDLSKFDNKKSAKILSEILGHSEENTRKYLSYLTAGKNNVRTEKTLKNTFNLFKNSGLEEISNSIKQDLDKITK